MPTKVLRSLPELAIHLWEQFLDGKERDLAKSLCAVVTRMNNMHLNVAASQSGYIRKSASIEEAKVVYLGSIFFKIFG